MSKEENQLPWPRIRIPESCRGQEIVVGIDEAGRGPVLGSLIYCVAFWPLSEHEEISKLGFDDSKQLKAGEREGFFDKIRKHNSIGWVIEDLTAAFISEQMLKPIPVSLNAISYDAVIRALETIRDSPDAPAFTDIYIDTVGDPMTYKQRLTSSLGEKFARFTIEKKADATYKVVSAASIIAKVSRDHLLENWTWEEDGRNAKSSLSWSKEFGSGYPSDEVCTKWLAASQHKVFGFPSLVRFSWATCKTILDNGQTAAVKWPCEEEQEDTGTAPITNFFSKVSGEKRPKRTGYFASRKMRHISVSDLE